MAKLGTKQRRPSAKEKAKVELKPISTEPAKPKLSEAASKLWDQEVPKLVKAGLICELQDHWLAIYCESKARILEIYAADKRRNTKIHANMVAVISADLKEIEKLQKVAEKAWAMLRLDEAQKYAIRNQPAQASAKSEDPLAKYR